MTQVSCKNVSINYGHNAALYDINFEVKTGDYICIVGENGSGKSTLLKGILGLIHLKTGKISFDSSVKKSDIGYLPQQTSAQKDFPASVFEVVLSGLLNKKGICPIYSKSLKKTALDKMEMLGIKELKQKSYQDLSGGQQQRTLLSRALCAASKMLVLDEPTSNLDPNTAGDFYDTLKNCNKNDNITIIMTTHDIKRAVENANKILHLNHDMLFFGDTAEYVNCHFWSANG